MHSHHESQNSLPMALHCSHCISLVHSLPRGILAYFFLLKALSFPLLHLAGDPAIGLVTEKKVIRRECSQIPTTAPVVLNLSNQVAPAPQHTLHSHPRGHLAMPEDCSGCQVATGGAGAPGIYWRSLGKVLSILHAQDGPSPKKELVQNSSSAGLGSPALTLPRAACPSAAKPLESTLNTGSSPAQALPV